MNESQTKSELNPFIESGRKNDTFEHHSGNIREGFTKKNTEKSPSTPPLSLVFLRIKIYP